MQVLSFDGLDGSGKTEQIRLLEWSCPELFHFTKPLSCYSERWPALDPLGMSTWWFEEVPMDEFIGIIIESLNGRSHDVSPDRITVYDRGQRMYQAVCAATWCTRTGIAIDEAQGRVADRFSRDLETCPEETEVYLEIDRDYQSRIAPYLRQAVKKPQRPDWMHERYARYQQNLHLAFSSLYQPKPPSVMITADDCAVAVHNRINFYLNRAHGLKTGQVLEHLKLLVGLGGYSESGKSSFANHLRLEHGFVRLKFRFFSQMLRAHDREATPQAVSYEILRFIEQHPYTGYFSAESLHGFGASACLKLLLGDRYQIVFMDAERELRIERMVGKTGISYAEATATVDVKDTKKKQSGSDIVRGMADIIVDNSLPFEESFARLVREFTLPNPKPP